MNTNGRFAVITGASGFIGSRLSRMLLSCGWRVRGIDCFTDYYPERQKRTALSVLLTDARFEFVEDDINRVEMKSLLNGSDAIFHMAAQPGVRPSWSSFPDYVKHNIIATQRLLQGIRENAPRAKVVYASSSSVYGDAHELPLKEDSICRPFSPYGVTKLAAENLVSLYASNFGLDCVSLRFFTVYGPGQRPDMAFHRFLMLAMQGKPLTLFGDGNQTRDFTYVDDIVDALISALNAPSGSIMNIGGGSRVNLATILENVIPSITGMKIDLERLPAQPGDVRDTWADLDAARNLIGYSPKVNLYDGLKGEWEWIQSYYSDSIRA